jgi:hypothetical protein
MQTIVIPIEKPDLGRVIFRADVLRSDRLSHDEVIFKLDSGSDFTTLSLEDLGRLGYTEEFLRNCPEYGVDGISVTTADGSPVHFRYLSNISIMFQDREIQGCKIFFALDTKMRSLFGNDILKYFNREVNYDAGELRLNERSGPPLMSADETPLHIYVLETT